MRLAIARACSAPAHLILNLLAPVHAREGVAQQLQQRLVQLLEEQAILRAAAAAGRASTGGLKVGCLICRSNATHSSGHSCTVRQELAVREGVKRKRHAAAYKAGRRARQCSAAPHTMLAWCIFA